jgi:hypothetical protein
MAIATQIAIYDDRIRRAIVAAMPRGIGIKLKLPADSTPVAQLDTAPDDVSGAAVDVFTKSNPL